MPDNRGETPRLFYIKKEIFLRLPKFEYHKPKDLKEACSILKEHKGNAKVFAGGTDLLVAMKQRIKKPSHLVSLRGIKGLDTINPPSPHFSKDKIPLSPPLSKGDLGGFPNGNDALKIGPLATLQSIADSDIIRKKFPILSAAADSVASQQIRYMGTIGGNISLDTRCWYYNQTQLWRDTRPLCFKTKGSVCHVIKGSSICNAVFSSDTATALMALDAKIKIFNSEGTSKIIPLSEFYTKTGEPVNILKEDEILTEIIIDENPQENKSSFIRLAHREGIEYPLINSAIRLAIEGNKICKDVKIVIGAVTSFPVRATEAEKLLAGKKISDDTINEAAKAASKEIKIIPNLWASPAYKRKMAETLVKRGIEKAIGLENKK